MSQNFTNEVLQNAILGSFATRVDEATSAITYIGKAESGSLESGAVWQMQKMETTGNVISITFADGNADFDNIWDNRASLSYS